MPPNGGQSDQRPGPPDGRGEGIGLTKRHWAEHRAAGTATLLAQAGPTPGWRALGRLLTVSRFAAHDPVFCPCDDSEAVLGDQRATATALALYAPEPRLAHAAREQLRTRPGDFWALVTVARAAVAGDDATGAERHALTAIGAEPDSLIPRLLLAYAGLLRRDAQAVAEAADQGLAVEPHHAELIALRAVAAAWQDRPQDAARDVARLDPGHLRYHLSHPVGHPMERSVLALVAAGVAIPEAAPGLGPLAPAP